MEEQEPNKITRFAKGKRPQFFETDGVDEAMSMILVLASEFSAMRDRLDTIEQIAAKKGIILADEIEDFVPDDRTIAARDDRRKDLLERVYYLTLKKAEEQKNDDSAERYTGVLDEIAKG